MQKLTLELRGLAGELSCAGDILPGQDRGSGGGEMGQISFSGKIKPSGLCITRGYLHFQPEEESLKKKRGPALENRGESNRPG